MEFAATPQYASGDVKGDIVGDDKKIEDVGEKIASSDGEVEANHVELHESEAKRILAKVDYRLVPMLALLYLVAFIDRSNSKWALLFCKPKPLTGAQLEMQRLQDSQLTSKCMVFSTILLSLCSLFHTLF